MRLYVASQLTLPRAIQEIAALTITHPVEITVKRSYKRLTDSKRARIHLVLRAMAHFFGYSESGMKQLAKRNEIPGIDWPGTMEEGERGGVWVPTDTMDIADKDAEVLLIQLEQFAADHGVPMDANETLEVEA